VGTLDALVEAGFTITAVVTAPDRPAGRGRQLRASAVKQRAIALDLPVLQPERLRDPAFHQELDRHAAPLYVVVAFRMLPEIVWRRPQLGTVNLHASLLPDYRGAAPINWAIINGERISGVTTFLIGDTIDTGDILLQDRMEIGPDETAGELHDRMMRTGALAMVRTANGLFDGTLHSHPQAAHHALHDAPKLVPGNCRIRFEVAARQVHDLVRGLSPLPGAWCEWKGPDRTSQHFKLLRTRTTERSVDAPPGSVRFVDGRMFVACADLWIEAIEVQPEGRKRMSAADLVRGLRDQSGIVLD